MEDCIFCKIANKEIPKEFIYEDEDVMVFPDIHPVKPIHLLIVPKKHVTEFTEVDDVALHGKIARVINNLILKNGLTTKGYRITVNGGGAQIINHLHYHLMGPMGKAVAA
jgi:histidine triad (HIT) family protein